MAMFKYVLKRVLLGVLLLVGVSVVIYMLTLAMPMDYVDRMTAVAVQSGAMTPEEVQHLKEMYGLADKSFSGMLRGYGTWLGNVFAGNLGYSFVYGKPVTQVIGSHMWTSFAIAAVALVLDAIIGIPLGIRAAVKQYSGFDYGVSIFAMMGSSLPSFFLSTLLIYLFSIKLRLTPVIGLVSATKMLTGFPLLLDKLHHLILPIVVITLLSVGGTMRYQRTNMLEVLNSDYIRTARAKGVPERSVIYKHTFRNTLIPLVTSYAYVLPGLFGGMMILESVFAIPGIGQLSLKATTQGDIPYVMGYNMFLSILTVAGTILADIMYVVVDPRVKLR